MGLCVYVWLIYYLTGVFASFQETSTDHVFGYLKRVGIEAAVVTQKRGFQALQFMGIPRWNRKNMLLY